LKGVAFSNTFFVEESIMFIDALGNPIVIGNVYGYSRSQNGCNSIHIGEAIKETKTGLLTMKVLHTRTGYSNKTEPVEPPARTVSIKPVLIFPVNIHLVRKTFK
jgi:hypothetical protein